MAVQQPSSLHLEPPTRKVFLKVIVIGDSNVGKTSLLERYVKKRFTGAYSATIGADFLVRDVRVGDTVVTLQIWDTAGQERFQSLSCPYYRGADACVLVFDKTDVKSFTKLTAWRAEFMLQGDPPDPDTFPFLVLGNKCDMVDKIAVTDEAAEAWCREHRIPCRYFHTSAAEDINISQAFREVAVVASKKLRAEPVAHTPATVELDPAAPPQRKRDSDCC